LKGSVSLPSSTAHRILVRFPRRHLVGNWVNSGNGIVFGGIA
jgi:hypothetical protein